MRDTSRLMALAALALGSMAGVSVSAGPNDTLEVRSSGAEKPVRSVVGTGTNLSRTGERNAISKALFGGWGSWRRRRFPNGPGWTHAHVARMARKRRNQRRNKRAHRR